MRNSLISSAAIALVVLAFAGSVDTIGSHYTETQEAVSSLNSSSRKEKSAENNLTWYQRLQGNVKGALDAVDMERQVTAMQQAVQNLSEHIINLVVVFILQTVLFPLLFLWLAMKAAQAVFHLRWTNIRN